MRGTARNNQLAYRGLMWPCALGPNSRMEGQLVKLATVLTHQRCRCTDTHARLGAELAATRGIAVRDRPKTAVGCRKGG